MNHTKNNIQPIDAEEINSLHGDALKEALSKKVQDYKKQSVETITSLDLVCDEINSLPEVDKDQRKIEDNKSFEKMTKDFDYSLNDAVLDLATPDTILEDLKEDDDSVGDEVK
ncbi:MAG: hypothetical protein WCO09_03965 [bacterium]